MSGFVKSAARNLGVTAGLSATAPAPAAAPELSDDVMKLALQYAQSSGQPLEQVLTILRGTATDKAAE